MSEYIKKLEEVGVQLLDNQAAKPTIGALMDHFGSHATFSGYADFTPITVGTGTKIRHANVERD